MSTIIKHRSFKEVMDDIMFQNHQLKKLKKFKTNEHCAISFVKAHLKRLKRELKVF